MTDEATTRDTLLRWLDRAYAMENNIAETLKSHVDDAGDYPNIVDGLKAHIEATENHAERVRGEIERLGGDVSDVKAGIADFMGKVQGAMSGSGKDALINNLVTEAGAEQSEIATYRSIIRVAENIGEADTVRVAQEILSEEQQMAQFISDNLETVVDKFLANLNQ